MGEIFINYRRGDDPGYTQALYQQLEARFGKKRLFMDIEGHIAPGDDFVAVLGKTVAKAETFLVVIGPRWAELLKARMDDPTDFVMIEIRAALDAEKRVIPVLVGGAELPRAEDLPEALKPLVRRNAVTLRPERFNADCAALINSIRTAQRQSRRAARETSSAAPRASGRGSARAALIIGVQIVGALVCAFLLQALLLTLVRSIGAGSGPGATTLATPSLGITKTVAIMAGVALYFMIMSFRIWMPDRLRPFVFLVGGWSAAMAAGVLIANFLSLSIIGAPLWIVFGIPFIFYAHNCWWRAQYYSAA